MSNITSRHIVPMICLWLTILICFPCCDQTETTNLIQIPVPLDAVEAIISLGSSSKTIRIGEKDADVRVTPIEDELGKINILLVVLKDSSGRTLSEVIEEVYVGKSGQTEINLQFIFITTPYIRVNLAEGEIGIKTEGWNFEPNEEIKIYLVARGADEPVPIVKTDEDGHFEATFAVPSDLISDVLAGETSVRASGMVSGFMAEAGFAITSSYIYVKPLTGSVGNEIAVTGLNFGENEEVRIDFGDREGVAQTRAEADGSFNTTFRVPEDAPSEITSVQAVGLGSGYIKAVTFNVSVRYTEVEPSVGVMGTEVTVNGRNFGAQEEIRIDFGDTEVTRVKADENGSFETTFKVPKADSGGTYIRMTELRSGEWDEAQFAVLESVISIEPYTGAVGTKVNLWGSGFGANEDIRIDFGDRIGFAQAKTDENGSFGVTFAVPEDARMGEVLVLVTGLESDSRAEILFAILLASILIEPDTGVVGAEVVVSGIGFGAGENIRIDFGDNPVVQTSTDPLGYFETIFTVPESDPEIFIITVIGLESGSRAQALFGIIDTFIEVYPARGAIGTEVSVNGWNFGAEEEIQIEFGNMPIEDFYDERGREVSPPGTDVLGSFETTFIVPEDAQLGETFIRAIGLRSGREGTDAFTVIP